MKKINKILTVLIIVFLMVSICSQVFAIDPSTYQPSDPTKEESDIFMSKVGIILGAVRNVGVIVAVITLTIIGIKYMLGSVEEKANYKATMMPYIIGCVLLASGTILISYIYKAIH